MFPNAKASEVVSLLTTIAPSAQAAGASASGWVNMGLYNKLLAIVNVGTPGSGGTVDAKLQQATDSSGTGAKDIAGTSITQMTAAGTTLINLDAQQLDVANGFCYVYLLVTVGTATTPTSAQVLGFVPRYAAPAQGAVVTATVN